MATLTKLNGYTKIVGIIIVVLGIIVGWAVGVTTMKNDIETNRANIILLRDDIKEIKQDVKLLLQRK